MITSQIDRQNRISDHVGAGLSVLYSSDTVETIEHNFAHEQLQALNMKSALIVSVFFGSVLGHQYQHPIHGHSHNSPQQLALQENDCHVSRMSAFDPLVPGPVPFSEPVNPLNPQFHSLNATTGEQWEFDAISADGTSGVLIAFYRDPEFSFLGPGNLRINLDVAFSDRTTASLIDYAEQSIVEACGDVITGTWLRSDASYRFRIAADSSWASIAVNTPLINGTIELENKASPRGADGSALGISREIGGTQHRTISGMHWMEPMPAAHSSVNLTVKGSPLSIAGGIGGAERIWQNRTWFDMLQGYTFFRAVVGPYTMSYWSSASKHDGNEVGNVMLWYEGKPVFTSSDKIESAQRAQKDGIKDDFFVYQPTYSGTVRSSVGEHAPTGYNVRMVSPSSGAHWSFHFEHQRVLFEFNLGRGAGGTAFMGPASGGEKDGEQFEGTFLNEAVDLGNLWIPGWVSSSLRTFHYTWASVKMAKKHFQDMIAAYQM